jgi:hypothetical protein
VEQVEVADTDPRGGKPSQIVAAGGHCYVGVGATEICCPTVRSSSIG